MANYLQRVIASGALKSVAERPPIAFAPVVPMTRAPLAPFGLRQESSASEFALPASAELDLRPATTASSVEPLPKANKVAASQPGAMPVEEGNPAAADRSTPERPEMVLEYAPDAPSRRAVAAPSPPASPSHLPQLTYLPGVTQGPRIQAPKGLRRPSVQPHMQPPLQAGSGNRDFGQTKEESPNPLPVERASAPIREAAPGEQPPTQPTAAVTARVAPTAASTPKAAETASRQSSLTQPHKPEAPPELVRGALPTPFSTSVLAPTQPQPPREATARPIAAAPRTRRRITIGRVDVQVNNRPAVPAESSQAPRPRASVASSSLPDAVGMDRFAMKP